MRKDTEIETNVYITLVAFVASILVQIRFPFSFCFWFFSIMWVGSLYGLVSIIKEKRRKKA
ncbi:hypothetical protein CL684_00070 [Candidatus Campbellbacteria bacterium]|nr:hypothetical protein [Candidatus Campbellbacteria bacterium]